MYEIYQKLLDEKGLKNADVARATGISNMTLSDWKQGKSTPKADKLQKIADFLGISVNYLMNGVEYSNKEIGGFLANLTNDEFTIEMLKKFSQLNERSKNTVIDMIDFLYDKQTKE